ncbi:Unknown protein sequence [Pseudomonas syringae pv. syringae]|uniref:Uncharacterized protein n=1 Tax=Pseudomonas syringae pv. solidagae TaxID=264458 RepID=A0A0Q0F6D6_PSESX|nr:Unknown protein sequence [Pseudomonas syringae pv. syringae]KPY59247.1 hypothetical protein ALO46_102957 [Pseudomonas syringae pv. solidagae]RMT28230.1 hypothetical protein ALP49_102994 [Pseudomonas syringae pv. solidagae]RMT50339.1 hypothetical protein ALP48_03807 [Pseudomonas syringae pv. solidagae]SOQ04440.1 hypothetical protein CFBP2118_04976 [Pseudomonas syringae pv. syringae]
MEGGKKMSIDKAGAISEWKVLLNDSSALNIKPCPESLTLCTSRR